MKIKAPAPEVAADELVLEGLAVGPGIAIGPLHLHESGAVNVPEYRLPPNRVEPERQRFATAVEVALTQVGRLQAKARTLPPAASEELGYLLEAYHQMLKGSRLVRGVDKRIAERRINAEAAVQQEIQDIARSFEAMDDAYLAARLTDIREVGQRLVRNLTQTPYRPFSVLPKGSVLIAEEMSPADTALLDPRIVAGFATVLGGAESHTAIMARSLNLPAVIGVAGLIQGVTPGAVVIVDGSAGRVVVNPTESTLADYRLKRADFLRGRRALSRLRRLPAVTLDGARITLQANVELPQEVGPVLQSGAEGIGLLRSEFMFMNRPALPDEDEQFAMLRGLVERMDGQVVTIRTLDAGGDKLPEAGGGVGSTSPLGLRAIRLSLSRPDLLDNQLGAILRAGALGPVRILLPMVTTCEELREVREAMGRVTRRLKRRGAEIGAEPPPLGVMIEVPGAALAADALAWHADFFAIGTNDLTQYTLAIDRADEAVAHLYNPLHPAVLRLIQFATEAALRARIPVSLCGEMAGDPRFTALLLGLGIRDLSMSATNVPRVKQRIRSLDLVAATRRARVIMDQSDSARIAQLLDDFNADETGGRAGR
ncbi:MAG: phosphoenolpyruvate--protein phosphotransferase [Alphaproteobacteria bacterium]|nr:phosphoenolpyruvate--protein phosphotransferase [Alphaproteobacteria bacterium]